MLNWQEFIKNITSLTIDESYSLKLFTAPTTLVQNRCFHPTDFDAHSWIETGYVDSIWST